MTGSQNVGFRVFTKMPRPPRHLIDQFAELETTYVTDAMNRFGALDGNIRPADQSMRLVGPALTVRVSVADNLLVYKAFEIAQPGDVIVIEAHGATSWAQWGDLTSIIGKKLGLAGAVMDGSLRDVKGICEVGFPIFAKLWSVPAGGWKDGPGEVNVPVAVGGVPILPGDIVFGDSNGVVVVPRLDAEVVLRKAQAIAAGEVKKLHELEEGKLIPEWLPGVLQQKGCEIIEGEYFAGDSNG